MDADACPCGSGADYAGCCGPLHAGAPAPDAAALMRSRYCAYVRRDRDYLLRSWHPDTRPDPGALDPALDPRTVWLGLTVHGQRIDGPDAAEVEFVARYRIDGGSAVRLHERSRFLRQDGHWRYLDALPPRAP